MKMLNNVLEVDVFVTSRIPIQSPRSTKMGEVDLRYAARPPERPAQVHQDPHVEDGAVAVAVAEHADGVEPVDEDVVYKKSVLPPIVPVPCVANVDTRWLLDANANAPRLDVAHPPNDHGVLVK